MPLVVNSPDFKYNWIEGVGDRDLGLLSPLSYCETDYPTQLRCHYENEDLLYSNPFSEECWITGVDDLPIENIALFPNPCDEVLTIDVLISNEALMSIYSVEGRLIKSMIYSSKEIDVSELNKGMYILKIQNATTNYVGEFIKH